MKQLPLRTVLIGALGIMGVGGACVWWFASQRDARQCSPKVLDALMAQATNVVSVSPDGRYVLAKERHPKDFEIKVFECGSGRLVGSERADESHLALSWRPDSQAFAFLAGKYGEFFPYLFDLKTGRRQKLSGPPTASLRLSPRWTRQGELAYVHVAGLKRSIVTLTPQKPTVKPAVVCEEMALEGGFAFSPDGTQMALVEKSSPTSVQIVSLHDDSRRGIEIVPQGQIRDLAWSPQQESLLVSARADKSEYYELFLVDLNANSVRCVVSACGDVSSPVWLPSAKRFIYHLEEQGQTRAVLADLQTTHIRTLGPAADGMVSIQSEPVEENKVFARHIGLATPPRLLSIAVDSGEAKEVFTPSLGEKASFVAPQFVNIRSADGKSFPAYVWRASRVQGQAPCALINVHGGPRLHEVPVWDAGVQLLAKAGINVITINYRGSSGYGRAFERQEVVSRQVQDIAAACRYATSALGVPPQRTILMGTSLGTFLASSACTVMTNPPGAMVLVSSVAKAVAITKGHHPRKVLAFHGELDSTAPEDARKALEKTFGADGLEWRVFRKEGHAFHRGESWGEVYSGIVRLAQKTLP